MILGSLLWNSRNVPLGSLFRCNWSFAGALGGGNYIDVLRRAIGTGVSRIFIGEGISLRSGSHMQTLHCL